MSILDSFLLKASVSHRGPKLRILRKFLTLKKGESLGSIM